MIVIKMAENCGSDVYGALLFSRRSTAIGMRARVEITAHFEGKDFQKQTENLTQLLVPRRMLRGDWFLQDYKVCVFLGGGVDQGNRNTNCCEGIRGKDRE